MLMRIPWDMTTCQLVNSHQSFREAFCLILQVICHSKRVEVPKKWVYYAGEYIWVSKPMGVVFKQLVGPQVKETEMLRLSTGMKK
jgi:hypothetical protein